MSIKKSVFMVLTEEEVKFIRMVMNVFFSNSPRKGGREFARKLMLKMRLKEIEQMPDE